MRPAHSAATLRRGARWHRLDNWRDTTLGIFWCLSLFICIDVLKDTTCCWPAFIIALLINESSCWMAANRPGPPPPPRQCHLWAAAGARISSHGISLLNWEPAAGGHVFTRRCQQQQSVRCGTRPNCRQGSPPSPPPLTPTHPHSPPGASGQLLYTWQRCKRKPHPPPGPASSSSSSSSSWWGHWATMPLRPAIIISYLCICLL